MSTIPLRFSRTRVSLRGQSSLSARFTLIAPFVMRPAPFTISLIQMNSLGSPLIHIELGLLLHCMLQVFPRWTYNMPYAGKVTLSTPTSEIFPAKLLVLMRLCVISTPIPFLLFHLKLLARTFVFLHYFFYCCILRSPFLSTCTTNKNRIHNNFCGGFSFFFSSCCAPMLRVGFP